jgi:hypothetical protein
MKLYTWNIPEISHFLKYDRYVFWIFHTYDTIQIPDGGPARGRYTGQTPLTCHGWRVASGRATDVKAWIKRFGVNDRLGGLLYMFAAKAVGI